jgi:hypothetical protein
MRLAFALLALLASCSHADTTPTSSGATPPLPGQVVSMETGADLKVVVSFRNDSADACRVTGYALAWGHSAKAPRAKCGEAVVVGPHASAQGTCLVPESSPMRDAAGHTEAPLEVLDVVSACPAAP